MGYATKTSQVVGYTTKVPLSKGELILLSKLKKEEGVLRKCVADSIVKFPPQLSLVQASPSASHFDDVRV
jgi:hypothetical protein